MVLDKRCDLQVLESHEMVDIDGQKAPNHLFMNPKPDGVKSWNDGHVSKESTIGSVV
jgi:hypothetical protein